MKSIKLMLTGIMLALVGTFFVADNGGFAFILLVIGVIVFIIGLLHKSNGTKKF